MRMPVLVLIISLLFSSGCASTLYVQAFPRPDQKSYYENGYAVLESCKTNAIAIRPIYSFIQGKLMFYVVVANLTQSPFDFSLDNVSTFTGSNNLKLWSQDDIRKKIQNDAGWQALGVALGAAAQSYNASQPSYTYGSGNFNAYSSNGYSVYGTYSGQFQTYNPAATASAQALIQAQASSQIQAIAAQSANAQASVQNIVSRNTIPPGGYYGGLLVIDPPSNVYYEESRSEPISNGDNFMASDIDSEINKIIYVTFQISTPDDSHGFDFGVTEK